MHMEREQEKCVQNSDLTAGTWPQQPEAPPAAKRESRILDTRLAEALGFDHPEDIRPLIGKHLEALRSLGELALTEAPGDHSVLAAYLNTRQAAFIAAKSDTPKALEITLNMVRTFALGPA